MRMLVVGCSFSHLKGMYGNGVTHFLMTPFTLQKTLELFCAFDMYDHKNLCKKIQNLRKSPDESIQDFHDCFINFCFEFLEDDVDWYFLVNRFLYLVLISNNLHELEYFKHLTIYLGIRASKSMMGEVVVLSDPPFPSHKKLQFRSLSQDNLIIHLMVYHHLLPPHILIILAQVQTLNLMVMMKCYLLIIHPLVPLILQIVMCCVHMFSILPFTFMRINFLMELVLSSQFMISFMMIMCGSPQLNKNL